MIPDGVLTSSSDKCVKMWGFDGTQIGCLVQSVLAGVKSAKWDLDLDVDPIIEAEEKELEGIIEASTQLARRDDNPSAIGFDFSGLEPGRHAAPFTETDLKRRIELSSKLLKLNFPSTSGQFQGNSYGYDGVDEDDIGGGGGDDLDSITVASVSVVEGDLASQASNTKRKNLILANTTTVAGDLRSLKEYDSDSAVVHPG